MALAGYGRAGGVLEGLGQRRQAVLLVGLAVVLRAVVLLGVADLPLFSIPEVDAHTYDAGARAIASGDLLMGDEAMRMSPGYFYFLGLVYGLFGAGDWAFRLVQLSLGVVTVLLVWRTARRVLAPAAALAVGMAMALYEPLAFYESLRLCESVATLLLALFVWWGVRTLQAPALRRHLVLAALWGLLCDFRPNALLLAAPLAYVVFRGTAGRGWQTVLGRTGLCALVGALTIAPVSLRNYLASGERVALVAHGGLNLFVGNGPGATGTYRVPEELGQVRDFDVFHRAAEQATGRTLTAGEADAYWARRTWRAVVSDPAAWLAVMAKKVRLFFNGAEVSDVYDYAFLRQVSAPLGGPFLQFAHLAPFAWVGLFLLPRAGPRGVFLLLTCLSWAAGVVAVFVSARYRLPVVPGLVLAAGCTLQTAARALRQRDVPRVALARIRHQLRGASLGLRLHSAFRSVTKPTRIGSFAKTPVKPNPGAIRSRLGDGSGLWLAALVAATLIAWPVEFKQQGSPGRRFFLLAARYHEQGRLDRAEESYLAALEQDPAHVRSRNNLAMLYEGQGAYRAALAQWRRLLAQEGLDPAFARQVRARANALEAALPSAQ